MEMSKDEKMTREELLEFSIGIIKEKYSKKMIAVSNENAIERRILLENQEVAFNIMCTERDEAMSNDPFCDRFPFIEIEVEQYKKRHYLAKEHKRKISQLNHKKNRELELNLMIFYDMDARIY